MAISGMQEFQQRLKEAKAKLKPLVARAVYKFAEEVMADSKQIVPVDTGALMNTGKVIPPELNGQTVEVVLGYGDESVGYALIVHEELNAPSGAPIKWTRPGSGPKYLERPLMAKQSQLPVRCAEAVKEAFGIK